MATVTVATQAHLRYLRELVLARPAQKIILEDYLKAIDRAAERVRRTEAEMLNLLPEWRLEPTVRALMTFRIFQEVAALTVVGELGDIFRFGHPRRLMAYLGLVSDDSWAVLPMMLSDLCDLSRK